jgi:hypothetical protein
MAKEEEGQGTNELPEGHVAISQAEHDAMQGENRRLKAAAKKQADAEVEAESARRQAAEQSAGNMDAALQIANDRVAVAEARVTKLSIGNQLSDAIGASGFAGEQASALRGLVDLDAIPTDDAGTPEAGAVDAAVSAVVTKYPALFKKEKPAPSGDETPAPPRRPVTPSNPANQGGGDDLITMEEYLATPVEVRLTEDFQARAKRSEHTWPKAVNANSFAQSN